MWTIRVKNKITPSSLEMDWMKLQLEWTRRIISSPVPAASWLSWQFNLYNLQWKILEKCFRYIFGGLSTFTILSNILFALLPNYSKRCSPKRESFTKTIGFWVMLSKRHIIFRHLAKSWNLQKRKLAYDDLHRKIMRKEFCECCWPAFQSSGKFLQPHSLRMCASVCFPQSCKN